MKKITSRIAKVEGRKVEVSIGNIREVVSCFEILAAEDAFYGGERYASQSPVIKNLCIGIQPKLDRMWKKADKAAGKVT